jgi:hypothetical protein
MEYLRQLGEWSQLAFTLLLLLAFFLAYEAGAWVARRSAGLEGKAPEGSTSSSADCWRFSPSF